MDSCIAGVQDSCMSYQFAHTEVHSRKGGKSGSVSYVLDEAQRIDGSCPHVEKPAAPELVHGMSLDALRALHDGRAEACLVTLENGKTRKIRSTQNTLCTVVTSFPEQLATADPAAVKDWEKRTIAWLRSEYGDALKTVVRHVDEKHPHLHAYIMDDGPEMRASSLHPGFVAQEKAKAKGQDGAAARRAYKDAMRQWQDRYWRQVGLPCGLARIGPGRRRLTRQQWHEEKTAANAVALARKAEAHFKTRSRDHVAKAKAEAAAVAERAKSQADAADALRAAAEKELRKARTVRQQAEAALSATRNVGTRLAAAWSAAQGWWTGERAKTAKAVQEAAEAARAPLEAALSETREKLRQERQTSRNLKDSNRAIASELGDTRRELRRLQPDDPVRPSRGPRTP